MAAYNSCSAFRWRCAGFRDRVEHSGCARPMRLLRILFEDEPVNAAAKRLRIFFVVVPCIFMIAMLVLPALNGLILSFDHKGPSLANYSILFDDSMFWRALANNLLVPFGSVILEVVLGLALALTLTARG